MGQGTSPLEVLVAENLAQPGAPDLRAVWQSRQAGRAAPLLLVVLPGDKAIYNSWTYETDPANLQPKVPKLNRDIAEHLRKYPPPDFEQARLTRALEAVEALCSLREQKLLRVIFEKDFASHSAKSRALVEEIERIGLESFHAPEPLPPITADKMHLICWMGVETA